MTAAPRNVAVVHDWLVDRAGAERVLEEILALFPDAVLYTLIDRMPAADATRLPRRATVTSWLQKLPDVERYFTRCLPLMPMAIQQLDLSGHDLVISSSHCVAKGVLVPPEALHLCYCHSPMRYAWDMQHEYLRTEGLDRGPKSWLARRMFHRLRAWDAYTANGVDHFAANSDFVRRRILKAYRREAVVIHPPVDLSAALDASGERRGYVTVGRLMGYKNITLMVEAFRRLPQHELTVVGGGPQLQALRRAAPANVRFTGPLPEAQKQARLRGARAFVFAAVEDFGIAPVEALAAGTPVIAFGRGGALDYLRRGDNAWLYAEATPEALAQAVLDSEAAWPQDVHERCRRSAERFGAGRFRAEFAAWVDERWAAWCEAAAR
ncbi:glycosyltransferase [Rubrivivax sp. JA1024]|nr:glycosyltransferase [Rubrivivax sp. JA1024]